MYMNKADYINSITSLSLLCITPDNFDELVVNFSFLPQEGVSVDH
jgi:hypothetical protein